MKRTVKTIIVVLMVMLMSIACQFPLLGGQTDEETLATPIAQTVESINAKIAPTSQPPSQPTNTLPSMPTITVAPTSTLPLPPTNTPLPCNKAQFVSETIPDNTEFDPGDTFTKNWRFKNIGTCTWNTNYKLVFSSGDAMGGPASQNLTSTVAPGATVDISVDLTAPASNGTYKGIWKLQGDDGEDFASFWVQIKVGPAYFAVASVFLDVDHHSATVDCSPYYTFNFQAQITTNGAGTVTYYWTRSDGAHGPTETLVFDAAGTKTVTTSWNLSASYSGWEKLYIDEPNHQLFSGTTNFELFCTP